jgi:hypothetical protein
MRFLHKLTAAVYIKLYNRHNYPIKSDVTNVQFYKISYIFVLYQSCSNFAPCVKIGPAPGVICFPDMYVVKVLEISKALSHKAARPPRLHGIVQLNEASRDRIKNGIVLMTWKLHGVFKASSWRSC